MDMEITRCSNPKECPRRQECYRAHVEPSQAGLYAEYFEEGIKCAYFVPLKIAPKKPDIKHITDNLGRR